MVEIFAVALIIASAAGIAVMIVAQPWDRPRDVNGIPMAVLAGMAGFSALLSTLGYVIASGEDQPVMPLVVADITMPLAVGLLWASLRRSRGAENSILPIILIPSILVGVTTLLASPDAGQFAKLGVLAVFSGATTWECFRSGAPLAFGRVLIGTATAVYSIYCVLRIIGSIILDERSPIFIYGLDTAPSGIVGALVIAACAVGGISLVRADSVMERSSRVLSARAFRAEATLRFEAVSPRPVVLISIHDLSLQRTAYGISWSRDVIAALVEAADAAFPGDTLIGRVRPGIVAAMSNSPELDEGAEDDIRAMFTEHLTERGVRTQPDLSVQQVWLPSVREIDRLARPVGRVTATP